MISRPHPSKFLAGVAVAALGLGLFSLTQRDAEPVPPRSHADRISWPDTHLRPPATAALLSSQGGQWSAPIAWPLVPVSMSNLPDGRIMTWSGSERGTWPTSEQNYSAIYDPRTGEISEKFTVGHNMFCAATTMTADGKVFVNGGRNAGNSRWTSLFDWRSDDWQQIENMASGGRWYPTTVQLPDGDMYTTLGSATLRERGERWNAEGGWQVQTGVNWNQLVMNPYGGHGERDWWPFLNVAPNGNIFHAGPTPGMNWINPEGNGSVQPTNVDHRDWYPKHGTVVMYDEGKMLIAGGWRAGGNIASSERAMTVDINGATPVIAATGSMHYPRKFHNGVVLPTGEVAVFGGNTTGRKFDDTGATKKVEIWNPRTGLWRVAAEAQIPRTYHSTALLMTDGRVISAGGGYSRPNHFDAEIWSPPYLFNADGSAARRPAIESAPESVEVGGFFEVQTSEAVEYFSLIKLSSTTHGMNTDLRYLRLDATALGGNRYRVAAHSNANVMLPGYWMLFAVNAAGVPSESQVLKVQSLDSLFDNLAPEGQASQSSTSFGGVASRAIDGNTNGRYNDNSVTHTNNESNAWWELDLGHSAYLESVRLWNRSDCCSERLSDFYLLVSEQPFASHDLAATLAQPGVIAQRHRAAAANQTDFDIGAEGRYVRVQLAGRNALQLAEVQVFGLQGSGRTLDRLDRIEVAQRGGDSWRPVRFEDEFLGAPVVIAGPASNNDMDPLAVRLREVAGHGFEVALEEWEHQDGNHAEEALSFLALPSGRHQLGEASAEAGKTLVDQHWKTVRFERPFAVRPVVFAQVASQVDSAAVVAQLRNVGPQSFEVRLREAAAADGAHARESVHFLAITPGAGRYRDRDFRVGSAPVGADWRAVSLGARFNIPGLLAGLQTTADARAATPRLRNLGADSAELMVQNETSAGGRQDHAVETLGWLAYERDNSFVAAIEPSPPAAAGAALTLSASPVATAGVVYRWNFGDGSAEVESASATAQHQYAAPGRYVVTLTLVSPDGDRSSSSFTQLIHAPHVAGRPVASSTVVAVDGRAWNVNPDNDSVSVSSVMGLEDEIAVGGAPWSLAANGDGSRVWVSNKREGSVSVINTATRSVVARYALPPGSQPHGIVYNVRNDRVWVALEALGQVLQLDAASGRELGRVDVGPRPRHLSLDARGETLLVSRYITPALPGEDGARPQLRRDGDHLGGEVLAVDTASRQLRRTYVLRHSDRNASENTGPGLPNYLGAAVISPDGGSAWVPSKQDNITAGALRGNGLLSFDQTVRAVSSRIDLGAHREDFASRIDHDNASVASHALFDHSGLYLFTALEGNRQVAVSDPLNATEILRVDVGLAPQGLALSADGEELYVHNFMARSISVVDVSSTVRSGALAPSLKATHGTVRDEALNTTVLRGKQLFYDARDDRLALQDYMSCAACHNEADHDGRTWDFTQMGEGLRNTISLRGKGLPAHGRHHWSANFDEIQDFEAQIRGLDGGTGLMSDADFAARRDSLGLHKAGASEDLDALAAYLASERRVPANPLGAIDDSAAALRGRALFGQKNCDNCHVGAAMTDSVDALLHDVGTLKPGSGQRLGAALTGLDTPGLLGLFETAPYLHDGSAATVAAAIAAHSDVAGSQAEDLAAYLLRVPADGDDERNLVPLLQGTPAHGVVARDDWVFYSFRTAAADTAVTLRLSELSSDIDLYVRAGAKPTGHVGNGGIYDGYSAAGGSASESVTLANDGATTWYVGVHGYAAGDYQLLLNVSRDSTGGSQDMGALESGTARHGTVTLQGWHHYSIEVEPGHDALEVELSGLDADADLYLRHGQRPSGHIDEDGDYDCSSTYGNRRAERCAVDDPASGRWYVSVYGYQASVYTLGASLGGDGGGGEELLLQDGVAASGTIDQGGWAFYRYRAPADALQVRFELDPSDDDVDLYVRAGARPSGHYENGGVYDCQSIRGGRSDEDCTLANAGETDWYIGVYGYRASGYQLHGVHRTNLDDSGGELLAGAVRSGRLVRGEWRHFTFQSEAADRQINAELVGLDGDVDLFLRAGERASGHSENGGVYDCGSVRGGDADESCVLDNDAATTWHVSLYAYDSSDFQLAVNARQTRSLEGPKGSKFKEDEPSKEAMNAAGAGPEFTAPVQVGGGGGPLGPLGLLGLLLFARRPR